MIKEYKVKLETIIPNNFFTQNAANSCDINLQDKSTHEFAITADVETAFSVGLIVGTSGSGKTSLAKSIWGNDCIKSFIKMDLPIINQFPEDFTYQERVDMLIGMGLNAPVNWVRPAFTLSTGERDRAEMALAIAYSKENSIIVLDEWTSRVSREIGKIMSLLAHKFAKKNKRRLVLISCHSDVLEWLDPDWVIDVNKREFIDRRLLCSEERVRKEKLKFTIRKCSSKEWEGFKHRHYLSNRLPGGKIFTYGLYSGNDIIGFVCYANYVPHRKGAKLILHMARVVINPEYCGFNLGIRLVDETSIHLKNSISCEIRASFSNMAIHKAMLLDPKWKFLEKKVMIQPQLTKRMRVNDIDKKIFSRLKDRSTFRSGVVQFRHKFVG